MGKIIDIGTTFSKIHNKIKASFIENNSNNENLQEPPTPTPSSKLLPTLMIITIIGTMLPFQATMAFFSLSFVTAVLLSSILYWLNHLKVTKSMVALLVALTATSVLSGCSPAFTFQTQPELIKFAHENDFEVHSIRRIGIFGLGLDDATIATAQAESNIKTVQGAQIDRGHGLVNIINVMIAGKS